LKTKEKIHFCRICFNLSETEVCSICTDKNRNSQQICVVEDASSILMIEKTNEYHGVYHVLGGVISPLDGIGPDDLRIKELLQRLKGLARGIPLGSTLEFVDELTLGKALKSRREI